jgi:hypothetical protein
VKPKVKHNKHERPVAYQPFVFNPEGRKQELLPAVYCWLQGGIAGALIGQWMAEDGTGMGKAIGPDRTRLHIVMALSPPPEKQEIFQKHYPHGYQMLWVAGDEIYKHKGLRQAYAYNQQKRMDDARSNGRSDS